jgi:hypothetical protein
MKRYAIAALAVLAAGGAILGGLLLENELLEDIEVLELRPALLPCDRATRARCQGSYQEIAPGRCLCLTTSREAVQDEITESSVGAEDRLRKVLYCGRLDPETGARANAVVTESAAVPLPKDAILLQDNILLDVSMNHIGTELDRRVAALCCEGLPVDDCWVRPGAWGRCPACLCDRSCGR